MFNIALSTWKRKGSGSLLNISPFTWSIVKATPGNSPVVSALEESEMEYICGSVGYSILLSDELRQEENNNKFTINADAQRKYLDIICFKNIVHHSYLGFAKVERFFSLTILK